MSEESWLRAEFRRAKARTDRLPKWARPVVTRPNSGRADRAGQPADVAQTEGNQE